MLPHKEFQVLDRHFTETPIVDSIDSDLESVSDCFGVFQAIALTFFKLEVISFSCTHSRISSGAELRCGLIDPPFHECDKESQD